jgi:hypothetical protein
MFHRALLSCLATMAVLFALIAQTQAQSSARLSGRNGVDEGFDGQSGAAFGDGETSKGTQRATSSKSASNKTRRRSSAAVPTISADDSLPSEPRRIRTKSTTVSSRQFPPSAYASDQPTRPRMATNQQGAQRPAEVQTSASSRGVAAILDGSKGMPVVEDGAAGYPSGGTPASSPKVRSSEWHMKDWAIPVRLDVGAGFGVPTGFETRCQVEEHLGAPDNEFHLSTYYTIVDYSQQGVRFYYDKEYRTLSYSTFPIPAMRMGREPLSRRTPNSITLR